MLVPTVSPLDSGLPIGPLESGGPLTVWLLVCGFVFVECALLIGMFLPGDTLLLSAGVLLAAQDRELDAWVLSVTATALAVAGNHAGYLIGRRTGTRLLARTGGKVLNRRNLERAHRLLDRWGFGAVVAARWIPWVRTLAPLVAGAARMDRRAFALSSVLGAVLWAPTLILFGYYGAALLDGLPWLEPVLVAAVLGTFALSCLMGSWRYRQDVRKPIDPDAAIPVGRR